jgi:hypothetical protein
MYHVFIINTTIFSIIHLGRLGEESSHAEGMNLMFCESKKSYEHAQEYALFTARARQLTFHLFVNYSIGQA